MTDESIWIALQHTPLDVRAAHAFLHHRRAGGTALFVGTTRQWTEGRETVQLEYESYEPMAEKEMRRLAKSAALRWGTLRICILHRLGNVPIGEASVVVGVAAAHRAPAFEACRHLIDTLKQNVPIWKREHFADGSREWIGGQSAPS